MTPQNGGDVLDSILNGDKPVVSTTTQPRKMSDNAVNATLKVITEYGVSATLDAVATMHHTRAAKLAESMLDTIMEALKSTRRESLDAALDAIGPLVARAKEQRAISQKFERAAFAVPKDHTFEQLHTEIIVRDDLKDEDGD